MVLVASESMLDEERKFLFLCVGFVWGLHS